jgi:PHP family Zn ribbon phosphoesterase
MNMKTLRKETMEKECDPGKYGMIICRQCNGLGRFLNEAHETVVCKACGGFGAVKSVAERSIEKDQMSEGGDE